MTKMTQFLPKYIFKNVDSKEVLESTVSIFLILLKGAKAHWIVLQAPRGELKVFSQWWKEVKVFCPPDVLKDHSGFLKGRLDHVFYPFLSMSLFYGQKKTLLLTDG